MGSFVCKQPNGLYCRFSTTTDCPTHWNMTEDEYIEMCAERAREDARDVLKNYLQPFEMVKDYYHPNNMTKAEFKKFLEDCEQNE